MKVFNQNVSGGSAAEAGRASELQQTGRDERGGSAGTSSNGDRVELSSTLGSLSRALTAYSNDRASKVQVLAAQYQSGSYQPSSMATSKAMVAEALTGMGR